MELKDAIYQRRSIRKFKEDKVKEADIKYLLELAMAAPSACNRQPWEFYVVSNEEKLNQFYSSIRPMKYHAPLAIIVCGNKERMLKDNLASYWIQDCSAAVENILLGVVELNLGAVWCGITPQDDKVQIVKEILSLDDNIVPLGLIYIGYPDEEKEPLTYYDEAKVHYIK